MPSLSPVRADNEPAGNGSCHFALNQSNLNNVKKLKAPGGRGSHFSHQLWQGQAPFRRLEPGEALVLGGFLANAALCPTSF